MPSLLLMTEVAAPIWRVYQTWRRLETFPDFVPSVKQARWLSKSRLYWREEHDGKEHEAEFEVTLHLHENSLSWRSVSGAEHSGITRCEALPGAKTRMTMQVEFASTSNPAHVRALHENYLQAFRRFAEARADHAASRDRAPK
jgi:uncharacterized membrane protein